MKLSQSVFICICEAFALSSFDLATKSSPARRDIDVIMLCSTMRLPRLMIFVCKYQQYLHHFFSSSQTQTTFNIHKSNWVSGFLEQCQFSFAKYALELHNPLNIRSQREEMIYVKPDFLLAVSLHPLLSLVNRGLSIYPFQT